MLESIDGVWTLVTTDEEPSGNRTRILLPLSSAQEPEVRAQGTSVVFSYDAYLRGEEPFQMAASTLVFEGPERTILRIYLPCLIGGFRARANGDLFVIAHLAQTLDGRIACRNGHSQWISNEANLHHAHRLRALNDAVMVGARTVEHDDPQLTVRHVEGVDPRRVVLNSSGSVLQRSEEFQVCTGAGSLFVCQEGAQELPPLNGTSEIVRVRPGDGPLIDSVETARVLTQRDLHSVFLEGGGRTVSHFLQAGAIDVLHVHIAPRILGSGIPAFELPEVMRIDAGFLMHMEHFAMDGELLFECRRKPEACQVR